MADSDSDDELLFRLTSCGYGKAQQHEDCAQCHTSNANIRCQTCKAVYYCNETCQRRHFKAHRQYCISVVAKLRMEEEKDVEDGYTSSEYTDSENGDVNTTDSQVPSFPSRFINTGLKRRNSRRDSSKNLGNGIEIPGLSPEQVRHLIALANQAEMNVAAEKSIKDLQMQITQLAASSKAGNLPTKNDMTTDDASMMNLSEKQVELHELKKKLQDLELRTLQFQQNEIRKESYTRSTNIGNMASNATVPRQSVIYTPLIVKDDVAYKKFFKLKDMMMPIEQIKAKMQSEGLDPSFLDTPDAISPNDPGPPPGAYVPTTVGNDPAFSKYFKLKALNMPIDQIKLKMEAEGVNPEFLDNPNLVSPNDTGPPRSIVPQNGDVTTSLSLSENSDVRDIPYVPVRNKDDPNLRKYFKLLEMGMPINQVQIKMQAENIDPNLLNNPDDISPLSPPPPTAIKQNGTMSIEQLYSILMQHQQIIHQVTGNGVVRNGSMGLTSTSINPTSSDRPITSVADQMAAEMKAAENAIDDIFGDENQQPKAPSGMSLIEQLEKKARKESNKKIVENREYIVDLIQQVLHTTWTSDEDAIAFYSNTWPRLETFGLSLGTDEVQTWSSRLLIKNKDTRDWYFSEDIRRDAGLAYGRLWSLSFLERDCGQLIAKKHQILNAPQTFVSSVKNKAELIDRFTALLKEAAKLNHRVFKSPMYRNELQRLRDNKIPERFDERGQELLDASTVLADCVMDLADQEFEALEKTTRAKKIRASTTVHIGEKVIQFVEIVKKLGAKGLNFQRLRAIEEKIHQVKDQFISEQEEEEEDDVL